MTRGRLRLIAINVAVFLAGVALIEVGGRVFLALRPAYDVVFLEPDPDLGWKLAPGLRFTWAGSGWYAREFSVPNETNSHGFRDRERTVTKAPGRRRLALFGDSMVEALQVPLEKTAGQLLEARLASEGRPFDVLNFGVSNYGVGQYLLLWERYARQFAPDFVFVFVADVQLRRTLRKFETGAFRATRQQALWVRPTFRRDRMKLVREPARDRVEFSDAQRNLIENEFGGSRIRVRESSLIGYVWKTWFPEPRVPPLYPRGVMHAAKPEAVEVGLLVLRELARQTRLAGSRLVVVDASRHLRPGAADLAERLSSFCSRERIGYLPLWEALSRAERAGRPTRWRTDVHFNEAGNEVFAAALYEWLLEHEL